MVNRKPLNQVKSEFFKVRVTKPQKRFMKKNNISPTNVFNRGLKSTLQEMSMNSNSKSHVDKIFDKIFDKQDLKRRRKK